MHEYLQRWLLHSTVVSQCTGSKSSAHRAVDHAAGAFIIMLVDAGLLSVTHLLQAALESAAGAGCGTMQAGTEAQSSNGADDNKRKLWCASWMPCLERQLRLRRALCSVSGTVVDKDVSQGSVFLLGSCCFDIDVLRNQCCVAAGHWRMCRLSWCRCFTAHLQARPATRPPLRAASPLTNGGRYSRSGAQQPERACLYTSGSERN
jgi:hypothetical protein